MTKVIAHCAEGLSLHVLSFLELFLFFRLHLQAGPQRPLPCGTREDVVNSSKLVGFGGARLLGCRDRRKFLAAGGAYLLVGIALLFPFPPSPLEAHAATTHPASHVTEVDVQSRSYR